MKSQHFDPMDSILVIGFFQAFKMACATNRRHKGVATWLETFFMRQSRHCPYSPPFPEWEVIARMHQRGNAEIVQPGSSNIIAEADHEIVRFPEPKNMSPLQYAEALWMKNVWGPQVYDEYVLKETFVEGLPSYIRHSMRSYCRKNKHAALQKFVHEVIFLTKLQNSAHRRDLTNIYCTLPNGNKLTPGQQQNREQGKVKVMESSSGGSRANTQTGASQDVAVVNTRSSRYTPATPQQSTPKPRTKQGMAACAHCSRTKRQVLR